MCGCHGDTKLPRTVGLSGGKGGTEPSVCFPGGMLWRAGVRLDTAAFFPPRQLGPEGLSRAAWCGVKGAG